MSLDSVGGDSIEKLGSGNGWSAMLGKVVSQSVMLGDWGSRC